MQHRFVYARFVKIILPICIFAFVAAIAIHEYLEFERQDRALADKLDKLIATYSLFYSEPIASGDLAQVQNFTASLIDDPDVAEVIVRGNAGEVIDRFDSGLVSDEPIARTITINYANETEFLPVGQLTLVVSRQRLYTSLSNRLEHDAVLLLILVLAVMASVAIAYFNSIDKSLQMLARQAHHDALTDLINRRGFEWVLDKLLHDGEVRRTPHVLLYLDLDNFKNINDSRGHLAGDDVLKSVARILERSVREEDFVARIGGDEFAVVLVNCSVEKATEIGENIRRTIEFDPTCKDYRELYFGISIGIAAITDSMRSSRDCIRAADQALYSAKRGGRNQVVDLRPASRDRGTK